MKTSKESLEIYKKINSLWEESGHKTANTILKEKGLSDFLPSKINYKLAKSICRQIYRRY